MSAHEWDASIDHGEWHAVVGLAIQGDRALEEVGMGQTREVAMVRALIVLGVTVAAFVFDAVRSIGYAAHCPLGSRLDYCQSVNQRVCYCKRDS